MDYREMTTIAEQLRAAYRILNTEAETQVWYTYLKDFAFDVVNAAVKDYIMTEPRIPSIANIVQYCKDTEKARRNTARNYDPNAKTVKCVFCKDRGLIYYQTPTGVIQGRPCDKCEEGRRRYPWKFLTEEQKQAWKESEAKKGRPYVEPHECSREFYELYTGLKA